MSDPKPTGPRPALTRGHRVDYATPAATRFYTPGARFDAGRTALAMPVALLLTVAVGVTYGVLLFELTSIYLRVAAA